MLGSLLWSLAALAGAALALLALPVRLRIIATTLPAPRLRLRLSLLGGLVPAIPVVDSARKSARPESRDARPASRRKRRGGGRGLHRLRGLPDLVPGLLRAFRLRHLRMEADFGLGDPAETGMVYGLLAPILWQRAVVLRPDFTRARLSGHLDAEIGLVPARLLPPLARFALRNSFLGRRP